MYLVCGLCCGSTVHILRTETAMSFLSPKRNRDSARCATMVTLYRLKMRCVQFFAFPVASLTKAAFPAMMMYGIFTPDGLLSCSKKGEPIRTSLLIWSSSLASLALSLRKPMVSGGMPYCVIWLVANVAATSAHSFIRVQGVPLLGVPAMINFLTYWLPPSFSMKYRATNPPVQCAKMVTCCGCMPISVSLVARSFALRLMGVLKVS